MRIIPVSQKRLWDEGVQAAILLGKVTPDELSTEDEGESDNVGSIISVGEYLGGKWADSCGLQTCIFELCRNMAIGSSNLAK